MLVWTTAALLALTAVLAVMRWAAQRQLVADTEHVALGYASFLSATVPDLDAALAGRGFSDEALQELKRVSRLGDVFRFKLFDPQGALLLVSDDLGAATLPPPSAPDGYVRGLVLQGRVQVDLKKGTPPKRPTLFSEAYVPVLRDGRLLGVVEVYVDQSARQRRIEVAFVAVAAAVAAVLGLMVAASAVLWWRRLRAQQEAQRRAEYLAQYDVLSGTLNRASFHEALHQAVWRAEGGKTKLAVLCIDVDHFKEVNDSHGHAVGDDVLRQVGARLRSLIRQGDQVARLGGDEFAVLQSGVGGPDAVTRLARRIVESLAEPFDCGGQSVRCGASVGAAILGDDADDIETLLHKADLALYRAKSMGRGCFSFYDAALDRQLQLRRELTKDLRAAVDSEQLQLHFQPLYEDAGARLVGYEALLRWTHPVRGAIPPATFIPLAEEVGLIDRIGRWVLQRACREAAGWPGKLFVAVNLSPAQFRRDDPTDAVREALAASGLAPTRLEVEITESLLMNNTEAVVATLHRLSAMGVRIAMDDFGTGYSSLAYLWRYPFDKVKIDRSFVHGLESDPKVNLIVKSIIGLAHSMDIRVNAEGVETPAQLEWLRDHGCDELQGFLLGRPAPPAVLDHQATAAAAAADENRHDLALPLGRFALSRPADL